ncbi:hypothetical protein DESC_260100 [Desulfosarcina cetonica]|nr:hypothetical protein DESC_260100 [Desulfosarcina cetonica]
MGDYLTAGKRTVEVEKQSVRMPIGLFQQVLHFHMTQGTVNVAFDLTVGSVKPVEHGFDFRTFGHPGRRAGIGECRYLLIGGKPPDIFFFDHGQGADDTEAAAEEILPWHHGADLTGITDIQEKGFDNIVFVVSQCQFIAAQLVGDFKESFASEPGA